VLNKTDGFRARPLQIGTPKSSCGSGGSNKFFMSSQKHISKSGRIMSPGGDSKQKLSIFVPRSSKKSKGSEKSEYDEQSEKGSKSDLSETA
jgi:hypothetical protein